MEQIMKKLEILAESAKYDVSCSSSGVKRTNNGNMGSTTAAGICHTWAADGRCISLLKVLFTNKCAYNCEYCVNRRDNDFPRASFEPEELAKLTIEFYRRNYIEGLFISSAVEISPDYTAERILKAIKILRYDYEFAGYIHAKIIPGVSQEILHEIGLVADRLSVNIEMPDSESLNKFAPQKKPKMIFTPMKQITNTLIERGSLVGPGTMFKGQNVNVPANYVGLQAIDGSRDLMVPIRKRRDGKAFAPAGQTTQMIIGAGGESDASILTTSENLYQTFKMKRVYYSAYVPAVKSPILPDMKSAPPLQREHRMYQADWLLRFYGFTVSELFTSKDENLDPDMDPKVAWAIKHLDRFPIEVNRASYMELMRIPGVGDTSAKRILRARKLAPVGFDELKKMGVVMKRAKYFITCCGKYQGDRSFLPETIRSAILGMENGLQMSMFDTHQNLLSGAVASRQDQMSRIQMFDKNWKKLEHGAAMEKLSEAGVI